MTFKVKGFNRGKCNEKQNPDDNREASSTFQVYVLDLWTLSKEGFSNVRLIVE